MKESQDQLDLFTDDARLTGEELEAILAARVRRSVRITLTRNRVRMVSIDFSGRGPIAVRLHERFLAAPPGVLTALHRYIRTECDEAWKPVVDFAQTIPTGHLSRKRDRRLRKKGEHFDLGEIYRTVNKRFFSGNLRCRIGWDRPPRRPSRRSKRQSLRYATYDSETGIIHMNPLLDTSLVPRVFMEYIVFHEMLHAIVPSTQSNGRCAHHPPAFRRLEAQFPGIERMRRLCRTMIDTLG